MTEALGPFLRRAWRWARRRPAVQATAARLGLPTAEVDIPEVTPMTARPSAFDRPRLNLLLPTIRPSHVFGGISTALHFFDILKAQDADVRVILTDHDWRGEPLPAALAGWEVRDASAEDRPGRCIVSMGDRAARTLPVGPGDLFVATAWWTAYSAQRLVPWQAAQYGIAARPLVYLVQDHEPGFYPLSSRYLLSRSTYEYPLPMVGVFNTGLLADFFAQAGYAFSARHAFEPELNPSLAAARAGLQRLDKERLLILYGRPGVPRNAFELVVQGVRAWAARDPSAAQWRIESLGEQHQDIALPGGARIASRGKLSLDEYAQALTQAGLGLSLMLSPHPSYPPLEMAEFGVQVVTNRHENKDLGARSPFIHSLGSVTPETIAAELERLAAPWRAAGRVAVDLAPGSLFAPAGTAFHFIPELRRALGLAADA
ncbi:rhamnosyltransferase WsaF family glycosyltransferase [Ramlibacter sp. MAHUQ-53]|uniref:rhamnosyltransferase WsaF family glycosyltransferase n=1 Tax=unclassified Ramlibacter TaxID=2617605 RepID=UPI003645A2E6